LIAPEPTLVVPILRIRLHAHLRGSSFPDMCPQPYLVLLKLNSRELSFFCGHSTSRHSNILISDVTSKARHQFTLAMPH
jgi:hypothetical protein